MHDKIKNVSCKRQKFVKACSDKCPEKKQSKHKVSTDKLSKFSGNASIIRINLQYCL